MSQDEQGRATGKVRRTVIEDLPALAEELSEEEASRAAGGETKTVCQTNKPRWDPDRCFSFDVATESQTQTATGVSFFGISSSDQDSDVGKD